MKPEERARRDLQRLEAEREKLFHGTTSAAQDGDDRDGDPMEILGKRIARVMGPLLAAGLLLYLLLNYLPRG